MFVRRISVNNEGSKMPNMVVYYFSFLAILCLFPLFQTDAAPVNNDTKSGDESALMNIWNYQIERKVKAMIKYKLQDLAVWEEVETAQSPAATRRYYVTPPATLVPNSAVCKYVPITNSYEVLYDIQLWEKDLPSAVVTGLKELALEIREDQIHPLPFYQARVIWNNAEQELNDLKLTTSWTNNLKQQQVYTFRVAAANNQSCTLLANTIRTSPEDFIGSIQLQFTVSAAKIDSKVLNVKSEHVTSSQLVATLKNLPGADGDTRYLTSNDYNRMLWQISNQVLVSEVTTGDYVDADDELSLKDVIAQMFQTQKENTAQFDDKMWNSVFWDPLNERPDQITKELNHVIFINTTDNRAYLTQSGSSTTSAKVSGIKKVIGGEASHSSSSSMTTDDVSHLLEQYDIQSEIDGNKFVPKKLNLQRLNVNDLTRKDMLATKRIRVRQVDIGGVLQIGIGNSTLEAAMEENQRLREQIAKFQNGLTQAQNERTSMQATINAIQGNANALQGNVNALQGTVKGLQDGENGIRSDVGALQNQARNIHVYQCDTQSIPNVACKDTPRDFKCPDGKFLQSYQTINTGPIFMGGKVSCSIICC